MGATFWLLANNEYIYAYMYRVPLCCVENLHGIFEDDNRMTMHGILRKIGQHHPLN